MAEKEEVKSPDISQHVFNSRFSWDMLCPLVNFYPCAPNAPFHIPPEKKIKVRGFFHIFRGVNWGNSALMGKTNEIKT